MILVRPGPESSTVIKQTFCCLLEHVGTTFPDDVFSMLCFRIICSKRMCPFPFFFIFHVCFIPFSYGKGRAVACFLCSAFAHRFVSPANANLWLKMVEGVQSGRHLIYLSRTFPWARLVILHKTCRFLTFGSNT